MNQHSLLRVVIRPLNIHASVAISSLFSHFAAQPWAMLLDSADSTHPDANFDIMVANPIATISTKNKRSTITQLGEKNKNSGENPLVLVERLQACLFNNVDKQIKDCAELPFLVGALGYFGYDLASCFETLPSPDTDDYLSPDMAVGIYDWSIIKNNTTGEFFFCHLSNHQRFDVAFFEQLADKVPPKTNFSLTSDWQANQSKSQYQVKIQTISDYLHAGDCYQINYAQRFEARYQGDEWAAFLTLKCANRAPFSAFIRLENNCIISISPERFLSLKKGLVQSKPIKGTRPRYNDPILDQQAQEALLNASKDRAENLMIVDLLRNDLSKHCKPHTVKVPHLFEIESFAAVHHLVSTVTAELDQKSSAYSLFQGAFPGGSITGAPKIRAMQIIDELEPHKRNIYCGSIAYFGIREDMDSSICIRTLLCEQDAIYCWAGGGIVLDSVAEDEYQESLDKVAKILPILPTSPAYSR